MSMDNLAGALIQRSTGISCAKSAKALGNLKDMRHFVRSARRWHAKAKKLMASMSEAEIARVSRWKAITGEAA